MYKFIRYFNQNREKIVRIIIIILFGLLLIQFFNYRAANNNRYTNQNISNQGQEIEATVPNNINTNSAIAGSAGVTASKTEAEVIKQFIEYCNDGNVGEAYNMLSVECKEILYPTLESFKQNYYGDNFENSKSYNIQNWIGLIYKIDLKQNILHTGNPTSESKQDFITVFYQNNEYKLNINNYIRRTNLNTNDIIENIDIKIKYKDTFMNYETYTLVIKNDNNTDIYLDNLENTSTMYIVDENNVKHMAYSHETSKEQLQIFAHSQKEIQIKFSNSYISGREITKMIFENVIFDETKNESKEILINLK